MTSQAYRADTRLLAPDSGDPNGLGRRIGTDLCHSYAAAGWELRS